MDDQPARGASHGSRVRFPLAWASLRSAFRSLVACCLSPVDRFAEASPAPSWTGLRRLGCALAAAIAFLSAGLAGRRFAAADGEPTLLEIDGNVVLTDEVYRALLQLPDRAEPTPATAHLVEQQIRTFLRRAGYALAVVDATANGEHIRVTVDEGRLAKIVVRGRDAVTTLAVRLQIDLPYDVFNRPQLERLLQRYRLGGARVSYALVAVRRVRHSGMQLDPQALMPGADPTPALPPGSYELHIDFAGSARRGAFALVAGIDPDSIHLGGGYSAPSDLLRGSSWRLEAQVGANFFDDLPEQTSQLRFSRVRASAGWLAPAIFGAPLRPSLYVREDLLRRQRQDLALESYWWNRLEGSAGLSFAPWRGIELSAELGIQRRDLFATSQLEPPAGTMAVEPFREVRPFIALGGRFTLDPERLRADRRHHLAVDVRQFIGANDPFWQTEASYRRVVEFGWNDLWLRGAAAVVAGDYGIADAIPLSGRYLRGVFGHDRYLDRVAALGLEYRVSLTRDVFKVGIFHEAAGFRRARGADPKDRVGIGNSFGPSFHALVLDVLQLDLYYAAGFIADGPFDHGVSLRIEKAF